MFRRLLLHLIAWLLLLGPALCEGGLVLHSCDCGDGCAACEHEDSCPGDPCSSIMRGEDGDILGGFDFEAPEFPRVLLGQPGPLSCWQADPRLPLWAGPLGYPWEPGLIPNRWGLPFVGSDRPLLI